MSAVEELYPQLSKKREKMKIALLKNYPTDNCAKNSFVPE